MLRNLVFLRVQLQTEGAQRRQKRGTAGSPASNQGKQRGSNQRVPLFDSRAQTESEANNQQTTSGDETDEPASPSVNFDEQETGGAECYPMVIIEESEHQLVDHSGPPGTPTSDFRTGPDRR